MASLPTIPAAKSTVAFAVMPVSRAVARLIAANSTHSRFVDDVFAGAVERWRPPATVPADTIPDLQRQLSLLDEALLPAPRPALLARILGLLAHYRHEALPERLEMAVADDWADDLAEFPQWAIEDACQQWRRHPTKYRYKPLPGDIRNLCEELVEKPAVMRSRVRAMLAKTTTPVATPPNSPAAIGDCIHALAAVKRCRD